MKHDISKALASTVLALAISLFAAGPLMADDAPPVGNCNFCHGTFGRGYSVAPRLAGQREQYILRQISGFGAHRRDNPYSAKFMWRAVANLGPETAQELAAYYASLEARPARDGNSDLVAAGRNIYEEGIATANVVACVACHGPNAEGVGAIPRLGGLSYLYLKRRLDQWNEGFHASATPMPQVSRELSANEIEALASYLSFVE
jgi:cytochrome c553